MVIVDIYCRVSTQEQAKEGYSIGEQEKRLQMFAEAQGWMINDIIVDGGFSGANLNRPGVQKLIQDAEQRKINKVCVYKLDRLSRSQRDTLYLIENVFIANKVDFVSMTESLDTSTPLGMAMIGILSVFAQLERETIKERLILGNDARIKSGKYHGNANDVIGYNYDSSTGTLTLNEYDAAIVREIFQRYISGEGTTSIRNYINSLNWRNREWRTKNVTMILSQPLYIGRQRWKGETYQVEGCPTIVSEETWDAAQRERLRRSKKNTSRPIRAGQHATLLGGIIWCDICGSRCCGMVSNKVYYYRCYSQLKKNHGLQHKNCTSTSWRSSKLDAIVLDQIKSLHTDRKISNTNARRTVQDEINAIQNRIKSIDEQMGRLVNLYAIGSIDNSQISDMSESLANEKKNLQDQITTIEKKNRILTNDELDSSLDAFGTIMDNLDEHPEELQKIVRTLIQSVRVTNDDVKINWNFEI